MARYIDADGFEIHIRQKIIFNWRRGTNAQHIMDELKIFPAADVAPVVHAHWLEKPYYNTFECSACCGYSVDNYAYCPRCGAKMNEEADNE